MASYSQMLGLVLAHITSFMWFWMLSAKLRNPRNSVVDSVDDAILRPARSRSPLCRPPELRRTRTCDPCSFSRLGVLIWV